MGTCFRYRQRADRSYSRANQTDVARSPPDKMGPVKLRKKKVDELIGETGLELWNQSGMESSTHRLHRGRAIEPTFERDRPLMQQERAAIHIGGTG